MVKRIAAIVFIFICTCAAWSILGANIFFRTYQSPPSLRDKVASTWGSPQVQKAPVAHFVRVTRKKEETVVDGKKVTRDVEQGEDVRLPLEGSRIEVALDLEHRQKGLLWYSTYEVTFSGRYTFRNDSAADQNVYFTLPFPAESALYDKLTFQVDGKPVPFASEKNHIRGEAHLAAGKSSVLQVSYASRGLEKWGYAFGENVTQVRDFQMRVRTNFRAIDFPENTLSPSEKRPSAAGWELEWKYDNLLAGYQVAITMPEHLQPGPLAGRISFFAPVSLFFFFFLMFVITTLRKIELHPMNYFFLAAAFFSFHLLLAYLVDHISIHVAFGISSIVSILLVVSYLRLVVGIRFAAVEAGLAQLIYLVLFSYAFFFEGFTGLTVTIGSILTLFAVMQLTGRVRWAEEFANQAR